MASEHEEIMRKLILATIDDWKEPRVSIKLTELVMLVRFALQHEEITLSRAREFLGLTHEEIRVLSQEWMKDEYNF